MYLNKRIVYALQFMVFISCSDILQRSSYEP
nr:MAG TPA: hypothetical protein [Caudoviricetes sp.]